MNDFRFGFTGTRYGMTEEQKSALRTFLSGGSGEFHHGDCVGADSEAHDIAEDCGYCPVLHPPSDYRFRAWKEVPPSLMRIEKPYMTRNRDIVDETIALIAAPAEAAEQPKGGTWSTVRYARRLGRSIVLLLPDGQVRQTSRSEAA